MKAAILHKVHEPLSIEDLEPPSIAEDEVLVRVAACGVCHTDLKVIEGRIPFKTPVLIGHEVSGTVEEVGGSGVYSSPAIGSSSVCATGAGSAKHAVLEEKTFAAADRRHHH